MNEGRALVQGREILEFGILQNIKKAKEPKETEVIYANLFELLNRTDMLNRMKKRWQIKNYIN